ncbi:glycosyltransferase [Agriterribacter humi]|uniref:glycosyltransferase n=1 Tax=Agriterribacter humi TaxID=1104781 RepID=UPI0012642A5F|nr:glycosyltransferase [Agriterribacter humi]
MKVTIYGGVGFLPKEKNFEGFIHNIICALCRQHVSDSFVFLSCGNELSLPGNGLFVSVPVPFFARPVSNIWCNHKVISVIKKNGADILISLNGCLLPTRIHQILIISDATDIKTIKAAARYLRSGKRCSIVTSSVFMKEKLVKETVPEPAVFILPQAPGLMYQPVDWERREAVKNKYTDGREYFLMPVLSTPHHHIIATLKAFSQFKKWQQSNMQLILWGNLLHDKRIQDLLQTYKYRDDIKLIGNTLNDAGYADVLASCMTMICLPGVDETGVILAEALQCGTPVIAAKTEALAKTGGDAVLYYNPADIIKELAANMMNLYKDEKLRHTLVSKGREQVLPLNEAIAMERLWNYIQQVVTT